MQPEHCNSIKLTKCRQIWLWRARRVYIATWRQPIFDIKTQLFSIFFYKSMIWKIPNNTPTTFKFEKKNEETVKKIGLGSNGCPVDNDLNLTNAGNAFLFWQVKLVGGPLAKQTIINYTPPSACITINEQNDSAATKPQNEINSEIFHW